MMPISIEQKLRNTLQPFIEPEKALILPKFFQTQPGGYGEGDRFLGIRVPNIRKVAKQFRTLSFDELEQLLASSFHEIRLCALFILTDQYRNTDNQSAYIAFYLGHLDGINNWDLVDASCYHILGHFLRPQHDRNILYHLTQSDNVWKRRIAIVSTFAFIRSGQLDDTLQISERLLHDPHDLIHKATGWMLREVGKQNIEKLRHFLDRHATVMPRTMLRYAIEKLEKKERSYYLNQKFIAR